MRALANLFAATKPLRVYAYLDEQQVCRAFRRSAQAPGPAHWHEVIEHRLAWLNQRLPSHALVAR